jgi:hypothetical protein
MRDPRQGPRKYPRMERSGASHNAAKIHQLAPVRAYNKAEIAPIANPSSRNNLVMGAGSTMGAEESARAAGVVVIRL